MRISVLSWPYLVLSGCLTFINLIGKNMISHFSLLTEHLLIPFHMFIDNSIFLFCEKPVALFYSYFFVGFIGILCISAYWKSVIKMVKILLSFWLVFHFVDSFFYFNFNKTQVKFIDLFFDFFWGVGGCSMRKFPGQGLNLCHNSDHAKSLNC